MYNFMVKKKRLRTCNGKAQSVVIEYFLKKKKNFPLIRLLHHLQTLETSELSSFTWFLPVPLLTVLAKILLTRTLLTKILVT